MRGAAKSERVGKEGLEEEEGEVVKRVRVE